MTRTLVPLHAPDMSAFAKSLKRLLQERAASNPQLPSHLELLQLLARAAGHRNYQTLLATAPTPEAAPPDEPDAPADLSTLTPTVRKALLQFDAAGRLVRLPSKLSVQQMVVWSLWTRFVVRRKYTEKEVNQILNAHHSFGDPATLRRELVNMGLMGRKSDCSQYWKEAQRPDAEVQSFLQALRQANRQPKARSRRPAPANAVPA